jgi:predicted nuclease of predicted toxin-antitoxin system
MRIWVDAQVSPAIAAWMTHAFGVDAVAMRDLGLREAEDPSIFWRARATSANSGGRDALAVLPKDADFLTLLHRHGPPPQVVWLTCGNTSNARLREILSAAWPAVAAALAAGEPLVEISDAAR